LTNVKSETSSQPHPKHGPTLKPISCWHNVLFNCNSKPAQNAGYHSNIAHINDKENATNNALSCLSSAAESDRQSFAALLTNNNDLATKLYAAMEDIKTLQSNTSNRNNSNNRNNTSTNKNTIYCWTHGYKVSRIHNSKSC
jgi:hypothetical protein